VNLYPAVVAALQTAGISQAAWIQEWSGPGVTRWQGDACGCPDDRCIGFHHDQAEECGCFEVVLSQVVALRRAQVAP
jgi:hypothetical protein